MNPGDIAAASVTGAGLGWALLVAAFLSGLRHGVDLDHLAAIADISSSQLTRRCAIKLSTIYAAGHALVLMALGGAAIVLGARIPATLDSLMGRLIGVTLIVLGAYVAYSLIRYGRNAQLRSRWLLLLGGIRRTLQWLRGTRPEIVELEHSHQHGHDDSHRHEHRGAPGVPAAGGERVVLLTRHSHGHRHIAAVPPDPFTEYGRATAFGIGMIHGVGAETPTQVLLFATAAGVAGGIAGMAILVSFVAGLFIANTAVAVAASRGFARGRRLPTLYVGLAGLTAAMSVYIGATYTLGRPDLLPAFLGG